MNGTWKTAVKNHVTLRILLILPMSLEYLTAFGFPWVPLCSKDAIFLQGLFHITPSPFCILWSFSDAMVHICSIFKFIINSKFFVLTFHSVLSIIIKSLCLLSHLQSEWHCLIMLFMHFCQTYIHHVKAVKCIGFSVFSNAWRATVFLLHISFYGHLLDA